MSLPMVFKNFWLVLRSFYENQWNDEIASVLGVIGFLQQKEKLNCSFMNLTTIYTHPQKNVYHCTVFY